MTIRQGQRNADRLVRLMLRAEQQGDERRARRFYWMAVGLRWQLAITLFIAIGEAREKALTQDEATREKGVR